MEAETRRVPISLFFRFLLDRPRAFSIGCILGVLPFIALLILNWLVTTTDGTGPDRRAISAHGVDVQAVVVSSELVKTVTIENRNPIRITYKYGAGITDSIRTLDKPAYALKAGDIVPAQAYNGDSMLPDFGPACFPLWSLAAIGAIFLGLGLPFLLYAVVGAWGRVRLYASGVLTPATVDSYETAYAIPFTARRVLMHHTGVAPDGSALKGATVVVDDGSWTEKRRGSRVQILVMDGKSCVVEETLFARCT